MTYIIGHKNPDTDAIVSSIVYSQVRNSLGDTNSRPIKLGDLNNETKFVLDYWKTESPETITSLEDNTEVALVDHNEKSQTIDNIENLKIISIIDHHKFHLETSEPLSITALPVGSTATIIAKIMYEQNLDISQTQAGLLISAIISDTLFFRSPTTTQTDKDICHKLNKIANIQDLESYSLKMFDAKSDLGDMEIDKIINLDYKDFIISSRKIGIGVMETTNPNYGINRKEEIIQQLKTLKTEKKIDHILFCIVDIIQEKNIGIVCDEIDENLFNQAFSTSTIQNQIDLRNLISRKKQIVPTIENYLK